MSPFKVYAIANNYDIRYLLPDSFVKDPRNFVAFTGDLRADIDPINPWRSEGEVSLQKWIIGYTHMSDDRSTTDTMIIRSKTSNIFTLAKTGWGFKDGRSIIIDGEGIKGENRPTEVTI